MNEKEQTIHVIARDASQFLAAFRHVFDTDWHYTKDCIESGLMIPEGKTFLRPGLDNIGQKNDEMSNWASRAALLDAYRDLSETLTRFGFHPDQLDEPD